MEVLGSSVVQNRTKRMDCQGFPNLIDKAMLGGCLISQVIDLIIRVNNLI